MKIRRIPPLALLSIAVLIHLSLAFPAVAGVGLWTPLGPEGGLVYSLGVDLLDPQTAFAGTPLGLFKTTDAGQTWSLLRSEPGGATLFAILEDALYVHFLNTGLLKSTDGGQTWTPVSGLPRGAFALVADPRAPGRLWAPGDTVYLSDDGGATWQERSKPRGVGKRPQPLSGLAVDPAGPWVYITLTNGFFRSADLGKTWQAGAGLRGSRSVSHLTVDAGNPAILYAVRDNELIRSLDRGANWKRFGTGTIKGNIREILVLGDRVYVALFGAGIFYSSDHGNTWTRAVEGPRDPSGLAGASGVVYAGTFAFGQPGGIFRSLDRGVTWERSTQGMLGLSVASVAVNPSDPDLLYAGTDGQGLLRSVDRGAHWEAVDLGNEPAKPLGIQVLVEAPSTVYAVSSDTWFFRSDDGGETWQRFRPSQRVWRIALDRRQPGALWGVGDQGLFHSDDRGEHWTQVKVPDQSAMPILSEIQVDPRDPRIVYVAGYYWSDLRLRLLRSANGGESWQRRDAAIGGNQIRSLALDPAAPSTLFVGTEKGLFRSKDAGLTWTRLFGGQVDEVVTAPAAPTAIYVSVSGQGIKRSTDGGATWVPVRQGLGQKSIFEIEVDPHDPRRLYAGTWLHGVFTYEEPPGN